MAEGEADIVQHQKRRHTLAAGDKTTREAPQTLLLALRVGVLHENGEQPEGVQLRQRGAARALVDEIQLFPAPSGLAFVIGHLVPIRTTLDYCWCEHVIASRAFGTPPRVGGTPDASHLRGIDPVRLESERPEQPGRHDEGPDLFVVDAVADLQDVVWSDRAREFRRRAMQLALDVLARDHLVGLK